MNLIKLRKQAFEELCQDNIATACEVLCKIALSNGMQKLDCWNLAFVAFKFASLEVQESLYDKLSAYDVNRSSKNYHKWLMLSFELNLKKPDAENKIEDLYIKDILQPGIRTKPGKPILYWHIPKCSGTSITEALGKYYYKQPVPEIIPGYAYKPLLIYLAQKRLSEFPYFSSMHVGMTDICPETEYFGFTILRDPVKRCLSMFRQQLEGGQKPKTVKQMTKRLLSKTPFSKNIIMPGSYYYQILPRYGWFWDYREDRDFNSWKKNIPNELLMRQLTTFSSQCDVDVATKHIEAQDYLLVRDYNNGSERELLDILDIPDNKVTIPKARNKSNPRLSVGESQQQQLKEDLSLEYQMLDKLKISKNGG